MHIAPIPVRYQAEWIAFATGARSMIVLDPHTEDAAADPDAYADLIPECTAFLPSALESERIAGPDHEQAARDYVAAGARIAAVKLGREGCVVATASECDPHPSSYGPPTYGYHRRRQRILRCVRGSRSPGPQRRGSSTNWPCEPEHTWSSMPAPSQL